MGMFKWLNPKNWGKKSSEPVADEPVGPPIPTVAEIDPVEAFAALLLKDLDAECERLRGLEVASKSENLHHKHRAGREAVERIRDALKARLGA